MKSQIETGTPYMLYKNLGSNKSSNLCIEYTSPTGTVVCNLASIALPPFVREKVMGFNSQPSKLVGSRGSINRYFDFDNWQRFDLFLQGYCNSYNKPEQNY
nr:ribonucleoside-diphosphate reductase large subunit [Ipomoea batatas]